MQDLQKLCCSQMLNLSPEASIADIRAALRALMIRSPGNLSQELLKNCMQFIYVDKLTPVATTAKQNLFFSDINGADLLSWVESAYELAIRADAGDICATIELFFIMYTFAASLYAFSHIVKKASDNIVIPISKRVRYLPLKN